MAMGPPDPQKPRLRETNAPEMLNSAMAGRTDPVTIDLYWGPLELFDLAHCVMLVEQRVIAPAAGSAILGALLALRESGRQAIPLDATVGDLLVNRERALIGRLGEEVGGRLHTARSRGDTFQGVLPRLAERDRLLLLLEAEIDLGETLVRLAREHVDTVMPGYSHLQQAQPTTLGH
jgi:argininosuccinate lyase